MKKFLTILFMLIAFSAFGSVNDLLKKAETGDANAQYEVGLAYFNGDGVDQDEKKGLAWLEKAALSGHSLAQKELGDAIVNGYGTKADVVKGCSWLNISKEPAANYFCSNLISPEDRTKALEESEKLKKKITAKK